MYKTMESAKMAAKAKIENTPNYKGVVKYAVVEIRFTKKSKTGLYGIRSMPSASAINAEWRRGDDCGYRAYIRDLEIIAA